MDIGSKIIQGGVANGLRRALASRAGKCLVYERMVLLRKMTKSPDTPCIFRKDRTMMHVGRDTAGVQYKRNEVLQRMLPCRLKVIDDRLAKIVFRHRWEGLHKRFPIETDAMVVENREKDGEIRIMLNGIIPVFPVAAAQILLILLALRFAIESDVLI